MVDLNKENFEKLVSEITREIINRLQSGQYSIQEISSDHQTLICLCEGDDLSKCTSCGLCVEKRPEEVKRLIDAGADRISSRVGVRNIEASLARIIDHTMLKPQATKKDLDRLCEEAIKYNFKAVCVNPSYVRYCAEKLRGTGIEVATVVGFPLGATTTQAKVTETREAIANGATEIDMVINIGALKNKDYAYVYNDIKEVVIAAHPHIVKVILETALLNEIEKIAGCVLAKAAGAHFVKTSTGFGPKGATVEDVALMRKVVGEDMGIKASGGIRDPETAKKMVSAGATRIGASASVAIVDPTKAKK